jgi:hypothetical protein
MTSSAWIAAARRTDRQPVLLMSVESVNAINKVITTRTDWEAGPVRTNINTSSPLDDPGVVIMATDGAEIHAGQYENASVYVGNAEWFGCAWDGLAPLEPFRSVIFPCPNDRCVQMRVSMRYNIQASDGLVSVWPETSVDGITWVAGTVQWPTPSYLEPLVNELTFNIPKGHLYARVGTDAVSGSSITFFSYVMVHETLYYPTAFTRTRSVDLGEVPTVSSVFGVDHISTSSANLSYTARGSNDAATWTELGEVMDGTSLAPYRYYDFEATFISSTRLDTPILREIAVVGGDSQMVYFSTHEDTPVLGARPLLLPALGALGSKIDLMKIGSTGEISPKLYYRRETFNLLRDGLLRNKQVTVKHGFPDLSESEYQPVFSGLWYDADIDLYRGEVTAKTRTILSRFAKAKIPKESTPEGEERTDATVVPVEWQAVNIITAMLDIFSYVGIASRYIDLATANSLRSGAYSGSDWNVSRRLDKDNKEDASKLLEELQVLSGILILQRPDGVISFKPYDATAEISGEVLADHATWSSVALGQGELFTRQHIYYEPRHDDDLQTGNDLGAWTAGLDCSRNDSVSISAVTWFCLISHQTGAATAPGTGAAHRAYWATDWLTGQDYVVGDVRIGRGPLYTCKAPHTSSAATEPGRGSNWRAYWSCKPIKIGTSAENYHSSYVLINNTAEIAWGLNKDVPPGDPEYQVNPGYQKQWFEKWGASPAARVALATRMDHWFATPKMRLKASNLPPQYFDQGKYAAGELVGVTGLMLPVSGAQWEELTDKKKFLVMGNSLDPQPCTVTLDLLEV